MKNKKPLKDILSEHADKLVESADQQPGPATGASAEENVEAVEAELSSLFDVAERVQSTLRPIAPSRDFEDELKRELLTTAHLWKAEGYVPPNPERDLQIIATVVGLLAVVAAIKVMWRLRE